MGKKLMGDEPVAVKEAAVIDNSKVIEELQGLVNDLKKRNVQLEAEKAELYKQAKEIKEVEKIVERIIEIPVERIVEVPVEKLVYVKAENEYIPYKYVVGDYVYYPEAYQRMNFEIRSRQGYGANQPLYRLFNHERLIEIDFVPENKIFKF